MNTNTKYRHVGYATKVGLSGREKDTDPPAEGTLEFTVKQSSGKTLVLKCFIGNYVAGMFYDGTVSVGEKIFAEFKLSGDWTKIVKLEDRIKKITWVERTEFLVPANSNYYKLSGEIVELREHPEMSDSHLAVLDCGLYVSTRLTKNAGLKIGDYVQMQGRLDAHIVGKVN